MSRRSGLRDRLAGLETEADVVYDYLERLRLVLKERGRGGKAVWLRKITETFKERMRAFKGIMTRNVCSAVMRGLAGDLQAAETGDEGIVEPVAYISYETGGVVGSDRPRPPARPRNPKAVLALRVAATVAAGEHWEDDITAAVAYVGWGPAVGEVDEEDGA